MVSSNPSWTARHVTAPRGVVTARHSDTVDAGVPRAVGAVAGYTTSAEQQPGATLRAIRPSVEWEELVILGRLGKFAGYAYHLNGVRD